MAAQTSKTTDFKSTAKKATDDATTGTSNVIEAWFTQSRAQFDRFSQSYGAGGQMEAQMEALTRSSDVLARGAQDFFKTFTELTQQAAERNAEGLKALMAARNMNDAAEAQNRLAQDTIDGFLSGMTTLSQLAVRISTETFEPINMQMARKNA